MNKKRKRPKSHIFANHASYYEIAFDNYRVALSWDEGAKAIGEKIPRRERFYRLQSVASRTYNNSVISVIFSAMTAEAFINHYGISNLTSSQWKHYNDLDLYVKWCVLPLIVTGKGMNRGGSAMGRLHNLIKLRNALVHYKSASVDITTAMASRALTGKKDKDTVDALTSILKESHPAPVSFADVSNGIDAVWELVNDLHKLDSSLDITWIRDLNQMFRKTIKQAAEYMEIKHLPRSISGRLKA